MFKIFRNIIVQEEVKLTYAYVQLKNVQLYLNYNIEILQHKILYLVKF